MSQTDQVIKHLESGKGLTPDEAKRLYKVGRLAARVKEARLRGFQIRTERVGRTRYACYRMEAR